MGIAIRRRSRIAGAYVEKLTDMTRKIMGMSISTRRRREEASVIAANNHIMTAEASNASAMTFQFSSLADCLAHIR